ncbi:MAG TPA: AarF/ABC1/UbiB kinase family protein [Myxococcota bacterium]|nr:AarF/ABC1/UbiB kinase family protein [Myxococcota bacterium]
MPNWRKLAGDEGEEVPTSRLSRLASVTGLTAGLSARLLGHKVMNTLTFSSKERREERLSRLMTQEGRRIVEVLGKMKGASMKVGQILSADPDLVPPELASELASLQTAAPPMPWAQVRAVLEAAWDRPIEAVMQSFEPTPRGAASIGQVHRGTLHDGRVVAIKLQYPGVEDALKSDLKNLGALMSVARVVFDKRRVEGWLSEVESQLIGEADYEGEGQRLAEFSALFERFMGFAVPTPVPEWTRRDVLVMSWVDGDKLDTALMERDAETRRATCERLARTWVVCCFEHQVVHGDPHPGNFLLQPGGVIGVLDFGAIKRLPVALTDGLLELFRLLWRRDGEGALALMTRLGFGEEGAKVSPGLLLEYLELICAPFIHEGPFDYGAWRPHRAIKRETLSHPSLWRLAPPEDLLPLVRVASGMKGLFSRLGVSLDVRAMLEEVARRRLG